MLTAWRAEACAAARSARRSHFRFQVICVARDMAVTGSTAVVVGREHDAVCKGEGGQRDLTAAEAKARRGLPGAVSAGDAKVHRDLQGATIEVSNTYNTVGQTHNPKVAGSNPAPYR